MRQAADSKKDGGKHLYYMAKEAESVEQYDELKEVIYKNKNKKKDATIALAQQGCLLYTSRASIYVVVRDGE